MNSSANTPIASSFADMALTTRVRSALQSDPKTRRCSIVVRCADGTATLSGKVPKAEMALRAQQIALTVGGVDLVQTDLKWTESDHDDRSSLVSL
jgi:hyperosmotically inducible periplasmic protein